MAVSRNVATWKRSMEGFRELSGGGEASQRKTRKRACAPIAEPHPSPHRGVPLRACAPPRDDNAAASQLQPPASAEGGGDAACLDESVQTVTSDTPLVSKGGGASLNNAFEFQKSKDSGEAEPLGDGRPPEASLPQVSPSTLACEVVTDAPVTRRRSDDSTELQDQPEKLRSISGGEPCRAAVRQKSRPGFHFSDDRSVCVDEQSPSAVACALSRRRVSIGCGGGGSSSMKVSGISRTFFGQQCVGFSRVAARRRRLAWSAPLRKEAAATSNGPPARMVCQSPRAAATPPALEWQPQQRQPLTVLQQRNRSNELPPDSPSTTIPTCSVTTHANTRSAVGRESACRAGSSAGSAPGPCGGAAQAAAAGSPSEPVCSAWRCTSGAPLPAAGIALRRTAAGGGRHSFAPATPPNAEVAPALDTVAAALDTTAEAVVGDEHVPAAACGGSARLAAEEPIIVTQWSCIPSASWGTQSIECASSATAAESPGNEQAVLLASTSAVISDALTQDDRSYASVSRRQSRSAEALPQDGRNSLSRCTRLSSPPSLSSASSSDFDRSPKPPNGGWGMSSECTEPSDSVPVEDGGAWPTGARVVAGAAQQRLLQQWQQPMPGRRRTVRGGLARRLLRLVSRQASDRAVCEHDLRSGATRSAAGRPGALVRVAHAAEVDAGGVPSVACDVLEDDTDELGAGSRVTLVLHDFVAGGGSGHLVAGAVLEVLLPWTTLESDGDTTLVLSPSYYRVRAAPAAAAAAAVDRTGEALAVDMGRAANRGMRLLQVVTCACLDPAAGSCDATVEYAEGPFACL